MCACVWERERERERNGTSSPSLSFLHTISENLTQPCSKSTSVQVPTSVVEPSQNQLPTGTGTAREVTWLWVTQPAKARLTKHCPAASARKWTLLRNIAVFGIMNYEKLYTWVPVYHPIYGHFCSWWCHKVTNTGSLRQLNSSTKVISHFWSYCSWLIVHAIPNKYVTYMKFVC